MKFLMLFLLSLPAFAAGPSMSKDKFCADRADKKFVKGLTQNYVNLMGFTNRGGYVNGGVCWWFSRFQRNSLYLTFYTPNAPKPSKEEVKKIVRTLRLAHTVVEIPGYKNWLEFSSYNQAVIQEEIETWQKFETHRGTFIRGLRGAAEVSPEFMKVLMDNLYEEVEVKGNIAYQKLQLKGVTAHAWLVVNMVKLENGYDLEILDSNFPSRTNSYQYREGDTHFNYYSLGAFTPYLEMTNEMEWINEAISKTCVSKK